MTVIGLGKTDLDVTLRALARAQGRVLTRRPAPRSGLLLPERPVQLRPGGGAVGVLRQRTRLPGRPHGWGREKREAWEETRYHQPSDELTADWDLSGAGGGRPAPVRARVQRRPGHRAAGLDPGRRVRGTPSPVPRGAPAASARLHPGQRALSGRVRFQRLPWPGSSSSPTTSPEETSRAPSPSWSKGCSAATRTRRCSGSPARGRPSPWPTWSPRCSGRRWSSCTTRRWPPSSTASSASSSPSNAVEYFVSYFDYYQPEAYVPSSDTYIEKDSFINDEIERMRHSATHSLPHPRRRAHRGLGVLHLRPRDRPELRGPGGRRR